jgi:PKD repeat protein
MMSVTAIIGVAPGDELGPEMQSFVLREIPVIDGNWTGTEWDDAVEYEVANGVNVTYVRMKHDDSSLYLLLDSPWDTTRARWFESETTWVAFDTIHNHGLSPQTDDRLFDTEYSSTPECHGHSNAWRGNGTQWLQKFEEHIIAGYLAESNSGWHHQMSSSPHSSTPHRIEELRIPLTYVGEVGQSSGFYLMIIDDKTDPDGSGPAHGTYVEWPGPPLCHGDPSAWPIDSQSFPYKDPCPYPEVWGHIINLPPLPPSASFTYLPPRPYINGIVTFDASGSSDADGDIIDYVWDFGDSTSDTGMVVTHSYVSEGTCTVTLNVTDDRGFWDSTSKVLTVSATLPEPYAPTADFTYTPASPVVGNNVTFDGKASLPGWNGSYTMNIVDYTWNFGDNLVTTVPVPEIKHVYEASGSYSVNLTVTDEQGWSNSTSKILTVSKASSQILLWVDPSAIESGTPTSITIAVFSNGQPKVGVAVVIECRKAGTDEWFTIGQSVTNSTGACSMDWTPAEPGIFEIRGYWNGDVAADGTESNLKTMTIEEAPSPNTAMPTWQIALIIIALTVVLVAFGAYFYKTRKTRT